jgi:hypothetical protein
LFEEKEEEDSNIFGEGAKSRLATHPDSAASVVIVAVSNADCCKG